MVRLLLKLVLVSIPLCECEDIKTEHGSEKIDQILKELKSGDGKSSAVDPPSVSDLSILAGLEKQGASKSIEELLKDIKNPTHGSNVIELAKVSMPNIDPDSSAESALMELRKATASLRGRTENKFSADLPKLSDTFVLSSIEKSAEPPSYSTTIDGILKNLKSTSSSNNTGNLDENALVSNQVDEVVKSKIEKDPQDSQLDDKTFATSKIEQMLKNIQASASSSKLDEKKETIKVLEAKSEVRLKDKSASEKIDQMLDDLRASVSLSKPEEKKEQANIPEINSEVKSEGHPISEKIDQMLKDLKASALSSTTEKATDYHKKEETHRIQMPEIERNISSIMTETLVSSPTKMVTTQEAKDNVPEKVDQLLKELKSLSTSKAQFKSEQSTEEIKAHKAQPHDLPSANSKIDQVLKNLNESALASKTQEQSKENKEESKLPELKDLFSFVGTPTKTKFQEDIKGTNKFDEIVAKLQAAGKGVEKLSGTSFSIVQPSTAAKVDETSSIASVSSNKFDQIVSKLQLASKGDSQPMQHLLEVPSSKPIQEFISSTKTFKESKEVATKNVATSTSRKADDRLDTEDEAQITNLSSTAKPGPEKLNSKVKNMGRKTLSSQIKSDVHESNANQETEAVMDNKEESHLRWEAIKQEQQRLRQERKQHQIARENQQNFVKFSQDDRDDDNARLMAQMGSFLNLQDQSTGSDYEKALEQLNAAASSFGGVPEASGVSARISSIFSAPSAMDISGPKEEKRDSSEWGSRIFDSDSLSKANTALAALSNVGSSSSVAAEATSSPKLASEGSTKDMVSSMFANLYARDNAASLATPAISAISPSTNSEFSPPSAESRLQSILNSFNNNSDSSDSSSNHAKTLSGSDDKIFQSTKIDDVKDEVYDKLAADLNSKLGFAVVPQDTPTDPAVAELKRKLNTQTRLLAQRNDDNTKAAIKDDIANSELLKDSNEPQKRQKKEKKEWSDAKVKEASKPKKEFNDQKSKEDQKSQEDGRKEVQIFGSASEESSNMLDASIKTLQDQSRSTPQDKEGEFPAPKPPRSKGDVMAFIKNNIINKQKKGESVKAEAKREEEEKYWALHLKNSQASK